MAVWCLFDCQVDVSGTGLEHLVNGSMGKALSVYATNDADKARECLWIFYITVLRGLEKRCDTTTKKHSV